MEQNITKKPFLYWVREIDRESPDDANAVGGVLMFGRSFSDDTDYIEWEAPAAPLLAIRAEMRIVQTLHLSPAHVAGRGEVVLAAGWANRIEPPFLLTNDLDLEVMANGVVHLVLTDDAQTIFDRDARGGEYPVESEHWVGLLTRELDGAMRLLAFSPRRGTSVSQGDRIKFTEWDFECGTIDGDRHSAELQ